MEVALGIVRDEQFGPVVVLAAGGVLVEVLRDGSWRYLHWTRQGPSG